LQPDEETFRFEWLDTLLDKMHANGIAACMATATAATPAWLDQKYPDVLRVERNGVRRRHGGRHTFCPHSPNFRRLSTGLARRLAERYKDHPALAIWHVSNEYGNHCYCDLCAEAFREWTKQRYGTIEEVNRRWYLHFWGATITDWSQIETPTTNGQRSFQGLLIDYDRFQSDSILECYKAEARVLREITPTVPITTNLMGAFKPLDYHKWAREMDIVSWDSYPGKDAPPSSMAFAHSLMRGLKEGQPWMLMEQTPSQQNWQSHNALKRPGVMRLWSYQAMAHGADSVMYFQWRRSRGAQEKYHGAVVEHEGTSKPRVFQEVAELGRELAALGIRTLGGRVPARVAILFDWDNWWAIEYSSGPSVDLKYVEQCQNYFNALHASSIPADIVSPEADLSSYDLVIAPVLYMVKDGIADKLKSFVERGGTFVTTFFSGIVDNNDLVYLGGYPGPLRQMLGIWAEEIDALTPQQSNEVVFENAFGELQGSYPARLLCDRVHAEAAQVLATYGEDFYAGEAAVTVNSFGSGKAYYVATCLDVSTLQLFLQKLCVDANIVAPLSDVPDGVEVMPRVAPGGETLLYVLNHNANQITVNLPEGTFADLITGASHQAQVALPSYGVAILTMG
jgi:beta-galactosidase